MSTIRPVQSQWMDFSRSLQAAYRPGSSVQQREQLWVDAKRVLPPGDLERLTEDLDRALSTPQRAELQKDLSRFVTIQNAQAGMGAALPEYAQVAEGSQKAIELRASDTNRSKKGTVPSTDKIIETAAEGSETAINAVGATIASNGASGNKPGAKLKQAEATAQKVRTETARFAAVLSGVLPAFRGDMEKLRALDPKAATEVDEQLRSKMLDFGDGRKNLRDMNSAVRSARVLDLINNPNIPIEDIIAMVMIVLLQDNDEELRQRMEEKTALNKKMQARQRLVDELRMGSDWDKVAKNPEYKSVLEQALVDANKEAATPSDIGSDAKATDAKATETKPSEPITKLAPDQLLIRANRQLEEARTSMTEIDMKLERASNKRQETMQLLNNLLGLFKEMGKNIRDRIG